MATLTLRSVRALVNLAAAIAVTGCASIYYPPEEWGRGIDTTRYPVGPAFNTEMAREQACFRPDLIDCISKLDPINMQEMKNGGTYHLTGWFVPANRFGQGSVRWCMVDKGWQPAPM